MVTIRCTQKLLMRWPLTETQNAATTTVLGDWYANILFVRPQIVLFINERSLLGVPVLAAPIKDLYPRFVQQMAYLLSDIDVPVKKIIAEIAQMQEAQVAPTKSRAMLASLNDMRWNVELGINNKDFSALDKLMLGLAQITCKANGYRYSGEVALELFGNKH